MTLFCLKVWGDYACYTRPEMKVERVSYDVITPSAARAVFESIFWKPPVRWQIEKIEVLEPIQWLSVRRNEVSDVVPAGAVKSAMKRGKSGATGPLALYVEDHRQQRASLILKEVAYRLHARMVINPELLGADENPGKYYAMFERRAKAGQVFHRPYLGCREFAANYSWVDLAAENQEPALQESRDLNWMLYDLDYANPQSPQPLFFQAQMDNGVIMVPNRNSEAVRG
jgi:CRISPR-associated protein Cas5d